MYISDLFSTVTLLHQSKCISDSVSRYSQTLSMVLRIYSGDYGEAIDLEYLKNFHCRRVHILAEAGADLLAFETIPNKLEAQVFLS